MLFNFEAKLDRPAVPAKVETEVKLHLALQSRPGLQLPAASGRDAMVTNICLVFDCSGSMAGQKRETAIEAAKQIVDTVHERHRLSLIGFATEAELLVDNARPTRDGKEAIKRNIEDRIRGFPRGTTNLGAALALANKAVSKQKADAKVLIVLSDGGADNAKKAQAAGLAATSDGAQIFAVGIGADYDAEELLGLVTPSNGAVLGEGDLERIKTTFEVLIGRIESFVATNASLQLALGAGVEAGSAYKVSPEQAALGKLKPDAKRQLRLPAGNLEKDRGYGFLLAVTVPPRAAGTIELAHVTLVYDVPSQQLKGQRQELKVPLEYTAKSQMSMNAEVLAAFRGVQLVELAEELAAAQRKKDATGSRKVLEQLVRRADELGDADVKAFYEDLLLDLGEVGKLSQDQINAVVLGTTAARKRAKKAGPQLYDVVLVDPGKQPIVLLRELRGSTGLELAKLGRILKAVPWSLKVLPLAEARALKKQMVSLGARAEVRPHR